MMPEVRDRIEQIRHGNVPEGYKKGKIGIVPVEWEEVAFSNLFSSMSEYTDDLKKYPLYSLTIEDGITAKTERYERSHLVKKENSYKVVRPNDYAYNPMNIRFGAVARHKGDIPVAVSGYYDIFTTVHESDLVFMDSFLTCDPMITYYNKVSTGSLIEKQRVHFSDFLGFSLALPPLEERKKIAEILTTQDKVIELEGRKIEEIKKAKQFFLNKMFPKKGQSVPEIRFKGFTDAWEQRKVQGVADRFDNLRIPVAANLRVHGTTPYYGANGIQDYVEGFTHDGEFVLVAEDGANDLKNYPVKCVNGRIWVNNHAHVLQGKAGIADNSFLAFAISQSDIESLLVGGGRAKLNAETLMSIEFRLPCLQEQYRIGEYLTQLNHLITLHQRKLEEEKKKKKALMQLLLTGIVRV